MTWLRASLIQTCTIVNSLPPPKMSNHITVGHHNLQRQLVPRTAAGPEVPAPTYIVYQAQQSAPAAPIKKKIRWSVGT